MFAAERFEELVQRITDHDDIRSSEWFTNQILKLQNYIDFLVAIFTGQADYEHRWIFMKAVLGLEEDDEIRQWNEKHIFGLPGFRCGINADGLLNIMLRESKAAWNQQRSISMPR